MRIIQQGSWLSVCLLACTVLIFGDSQSFAQGYSTPAPPPPPLNDDGTIHWGTFYKSAAIQKAYERLWNLGACRGTNKRITIPVENNKMIIDSLPESDFEGVVQASAGSIRGGLIAFFDTSGSSSVSKTRVVQLHPAGVSSLHVHGPSNMAILSPGMIVRLQAMLDIRGHGIDEVDLIEIITPPSVFEAPSIQPKQRIELIGRINSIEKQRLILQLPHTTNGMKRVILHLSDTAVVRFDAAQVEYISPGDQISVTGRIWTGEGSMATGTVFASQVKVIKK